MSSAKESNRRVVEHKKYVKDEKYVTNHGIEYTIYVTVVDGFVEEYLIKSASATDVFTKIIW
jgi:hypothetical protein